MSRRRIPKYVAIVRERGPAWNPSLPMREQSHWEDHARFMDALASEGFVVLGGPWGEGERSFLLVFDSDKESVRTRLENDPWTRMGYLRIARIDVWKILLRKGEPTGSARSKDP